MSGNGKREDKFIELYALGLPTTEAAIKAGYSESYAKTSIRLRFNSPRFIRKLASYVADIPEARQELAKARLLKLYNIEDKVLDKASDDLDYAVTPGVSKLIEREYRLTGLLQDDHARPVMVQVNLALLQNTQESDLEPIKVKHIEHDNEDDTK